MKKHFYYTPDAVFSIKGFLNDPLHHLATQICYQVYIVKELYLKNKQFVETTSHILVFMQHKYYMKQFTQLHFKFSFTSTFTQTLL